MTHDTKSRKKKSFGLIIALVIVLVITAVSLLLSQRHGAIPEVPSNYTLGATVPFFSNEPGFVNATAQLAYLGQKPFIRIMAMNVTTCPDAIVSFTAANNGIANTNPPLTLGAVTYLTGNTNYEIPLHTNVSAYDAVVVWCPSKNVQLGVANLRS